MCIILTGLRRLSSNSVGQFLQSSRLSHSGQLAMAKPRVVKVPERCELLHPTEEEDKGNDIFCTL